MLLALTPHPDTPPEAIAAVEAEVARDPSGKLGLRYVVRGDTRRLLRLPVQPQGRADDLWKHTCFEAFVQRTDGAGYYEFNLSPSTRWAAYGFGAYRSGMGRADEAGLLDLVQQDRGDYELTASLDLSGLPGLDAEAPWRVALTAVIEETGGRKSYWSLAHAPGKPDFHHPDAFAHSLPAAEHP